MPHLGRIDLHATVGIEIGRDRRRDTGSAKRVEPLRRAVLPQSIVEIHLVRRLVVDHHDVGIAIAIEIGHEHLPRGAPVACNALRLPDRAERSVEIVVE